LTAADRIGDVSEEVRKCQICGEDAEPGRWMLCIGCQARIEENNRMHWGGDL
jgi:hypothetical protein